MAPQKKDRKTEGRQAGRQEGWKEEKEKGGKEERMGKIIENNAGHLLFHKTYIGMGILGHDKYLFVTMGCS